MKRLLKEEIFHFKTGEPGELDESGKLDEYGEPGSKEEKNSLRDTNLCNRKPRHASSFFLECTDFKNVIFEKIHWAHSEDAEVAEVKRP